jgi:NAD+ kinase
MTDRRVLLVVNPANDQAHVVLAQVTSALADAGIATSITTEDALDLATHGAPAIDARTQIVESTEDSANGTDVVVVIGGDGTVLRAAERARNSGVPLFAVNLGHVGFLAEAEREDVTDVVHAIVHRRWVVEERMTMAVRVMRNGDSVHETWALNEAALEKVARQHIIDIVVEIDGRPLSRWGCDGVVAATPTGSTAYAFSAGGPVVWPEVSALLVVPLSAHALFSRPLVVAPTSTIAFELGEGDQAVLSADGRRVIDVQGGSRIEVRQDPRPVRFARLATAPFTDRLVAKFDLPVQGWRGRRPEGA